MKGLISKVKKYSVAAEAGIKKGESLCLVNGEALQDILDVSFAAAVEELDLTLEGLDGKVRTVHISKDPDEDLGLEFETAVFNGVRCCQNHCLFCFVDQMIPGMRKQLYVRDDDYRLSFLYGNFITLTNMDAADFKYILQRHLSPLYVSVHTTNPDLRSSMMRNETAAELMPRLQALLDAGIEVHAQVVCCPGYNDGTELEKTYRDLRALAPRLATMAVVPVGLTKNREHLPALRTFTQAEAKNLVKKVTVWQKECRASLGKSFIYLGDEFYLLADLPLPPEAWYDGFPQLENGIGLSRNFLCEWERAVRQVKPEMTPTYVIPVGESAAKVLQPLVTNFNKLYGTSHQLVAVRNKFFGPLVNVTGLLTGGDILAALPEKGQVLLPAVILNQDQLFLDDMTLATFKEQAHRPVKLIHTGAELYQTLSGT
jgi:putative radical SAM enzyme (TIGR03279 family)